MPGDSRHGQHKPFFPLLGLHSCDSTKMDVGRPAATSVGPGVQVSPQRSVSPAMRPTEKIDDAPYSTQSARSSILFGAGAGSPSPVCGSAGDGCMSPGMRLFLPMRALVSHPTWPVPLHPCYPAPSLPDSGPYAISTLFETLRLQNIMKLVCFSIPIHVNFVFHGTLRAVSRLLMCRP